MENTLKSKDGKFTFERGKSYAMKYRRTTALHIYEKEYDWYRTEWSTSRKQTYDGYINFNQLPERYTWFTNLGKGKMVCTELTESQVKELDAAFNTYEKIEEKNREEKYKKKIRK